MREKHPGVYTSEKHPHEDIKPYSIVNTASIQEDETVDDKNKEQQRKEKQSSNDTISKPYVIDKVAWDTAHALTVTQPIIHREISGRTRYGKF